MYYKNENKAPEEMPESYKLLPPEGNVFGYGKWTFSDEQGNPLGELLFMETVRSWQERIAGKSPAEILNEWIHEMGMEKVKAMEKLSQIAVCYKTLEELLQMLELVWRAT